MEICIIFGESPAFDVRQTPWDVALIRNDVHLRNRKLWKDLKYISVKGKPLLVSDAWRPQKFRHVSKSLSLLLPLRRTRLMKSAP